MDSSDQKPVSPTQPTTQVTPAAANAASVGTEVWFLAAGRVWPQLGTGEYPWYRKSQVFAPEKFGDWNTLIPQVAEALAAFAKKG